MSEYREIIEEKYGDSDEFHEHLRDFFENHKEAGERDLDVNYDYWLDQYLCSSEYEDVINGIIDDEIVARADAKLRGRDW
jgi:hypothetical protein